MAAPDDSSPSVYRITLFDNEWDLQVAEGFITQSPVDVIPTSGIITSGRTNPEPFFEHGDASDFLNSTYYVQPGDIVSFDTSTLQILNQGTPENVTFEWKVRHYDQNSDWAYLVGTDSTWAPSSETFTVPAFDEPNGIDAWEYFYLLMQATTANGDVVSINETIILRLYSDGTLTEQEFNEAMNEGPVYDFSAFSAALPSPIGQGDPASSADLSGGKLSIQETGETLQGALYSLNLVSQDEHLVLDPALITELLSYTSDYEGDLSLIHI